MSQPEVRAGKISGIEFQADAHEIDVIGGIAEYAGSARIAVYVTRECFEVHALVHLVGGRQGQIVYIVGPVDLLIVIADNICRCRQNDIPTKLVIDTEARSENR